MAERSNTRRRLLIAVAALLVLAFVGYFVWQRLSGTDLPDGFASGNGRIEAVEIDISAKIPGRLADILVDEGDFVTAGQVLARMDTDPARGAAPPGRGRAAPREDRRRDRAQPRPQREAEKRAAEAVVAQRRADNDAAQRQLARSIPLAKSNTIPQSVLDNDRAKADAAAAALAAAEAQLAASEAAIGAANAAVVDAEAAVDAAAAAIESIQADIDDSDAARAARRPRAVPRRPARRGRSPRAGGCSTWSISATST